MLRGAESYFESIVKKNHEHEAWWESTRENHTKKNKKLNIRGLESYSVGYFEFPLKSKHNIYKGFKVSFIYTVYFMTNTPPVNNPPNQGHNLKSWLQRAKPPPPLF